MEQFEDSVQTSESVLSKKLTQQAVKKKCCVPNCNNSYNKCPNTIFFFIPKSLFRLEVFDAIEVGTGVRPTCSISTTIYVCESHYKMEDDVEFWERCNPKTATVPYPIRLKKGVLPHIFECDGNNVSVLKIQSSPTNAGLMSGCNIPEHETQHSEFDPLNSSYSQNTASPVECALEVVYVPSVNSNSSTNTDLDALNSSSLKLQSKSLNMKLCYEYSKLFLGIEIDKLSILTMLQEHIGRKESERDIYIVLRKMKLNESFEILGLYFGVSACQVSIVFDEVLPEIANCFRTLFFQPSNEIPYLNLPTSIEANYNAVTAILDVFEIETQMLSDSHDQALTSCSTFKFLISMTPDGQINYVSKAFGAKIKDFLLAVESGYIDYLKENSTVLTFRKFEHLEAELAVKNCNLLRPPSISADDVLTEEKSLVTNQVETLRMHVDKVASRLREFAIFAPHACLDHTLISKLDDIAVVVAGLVNL